MPVQKLRKALFRSGTVATALLLIGAGLFASPVQAAQLNNRSLQLSDSRPDAVATYAVSMDLVTPATLGSIRILFCSDLAIIDMPCSAPAGFDATGAHIVSQTGVSGFTIDPASTANEIILTRTPSAHAAGTIGITFDNIHNQSAVSSSFARYHVYPTNDASGAWTDAGGLAYAINGDFSVSTEVPPYLTMCVAVRIANNDCSDAQGSFLQLGQLSTARTASGQSQVVVATNAADGYTVRIQGNTMISGNNVIPALATQTASQVGSSQFGINLAANTTPNQGSLPTGPGGGGATSGYSQANRFKYASGDVIAGSTAPDDYRRYTISYIGNINRSQPHGVYSSSYAFIGLGNF